MLVVVVCRPRSTTQLDGSSCLSRYGCVIVLFVEFVVVGLL